MYRYHWEKLHIDHCWELKGQHYQLYFFRQIKAAGKDPDKEELDKIELECVSKVCFFFLVLTNATCSPFHQYTPKSVGCCLIVVASFFQDKRLSEVNSLFKEVDVRRKVRAHLLTSVCWMYYVYLKKQCESLVVIIIPMVKSWIFPSEVVGADIRKFKILFTYCTSKAWWNSYIFYNKISASYQWIDRSNFKTRSGHFDVFLDRTPYTHNVSLQP